MAEALACTTADPRATRPDADALREMVRDAQDERRAFAHLRTLEELLELDEPARLGEYFKASTPAAFVPLDVSRSWQAFYRQAALLFAYLWADGNGARRGALVAYLGAVLGGNGGAAEFEACFLGAGAAEIERGFLDWLVREHQRAYPVERIDVERVRAALKRGGKGMEPPPPPLALADLTGEERLALALAQWAHGDERVAGAALEELGAADADARLAAPLRERVERERRRFSRWTAQRDAYLSSFVGGTSSFAFKLDGKGFKAKVLAFADGVLTLEANRSGRERLAVAEIDALELAQAMPRAGPEDWARLLPYVLREDARAKKLVKEDGGEGSALLADAQADYPARLALGRVAASLLALSKAPEPRTEEALEALLTEARTVLAQGASLALLERKRAALLGRVRAWLETKYELGGPAALLAGKVETLAGERVRITYAFDDPRELEDFDPTLYPVLATKGWGVLKAPDQPFRVEGGTLVGQGRATLHSWLDLVPPYTLRYDLTFVDGEEKGATRWFALGVADDRRERFAWGVNLDVLQVQDGESEAQARGGIERWFMDSAYAMELAHDGKQITLRCETKECSLPAGARREGGFFLYVHSEYPVRLAQLEVEAKLLPSSLRRLRALRVERDLAGY
ncbi:MAG: hypothetical protein EXS08_03825 [Planctomycetes bacterium]|nr:hypothetical protein [Planctomycetota bacterium]